MANSELFILGNPRFLSNGATFVNNTSYDNEPPTINHGETVTTKSIMSNATSVGDFALNSVICAIESKGQQIHYGRDPYHAHSWHPDSCSTRMNVFTEQDSVPTVGVEIETYLREGLSESAMRDCLRSNWFHFETDGSLDRVLGNELITEVLPPRVYTDIRTWLGLQNLTAPYLHSFTESSTGLHVHVGTSQFKNIDNLPVSREERVWIGKFLCAFVYYGLLDQTFISKVMLRTAGSYCASRWPRCMDSVITAGRVAGATGHEVINAILNSFYWDGYIKADLDGLLRRGLRQTLDSSTRPVAGRWYKHDTTPPPEFHEHGVEINMDHPCTIEFRRGKGTLNAVSIHRMVEFASLVVRYAWKMARDPSMPVSSRGVYEFIINNTNSKALATTAQEYLDEIVKRKES